MYLSTAAVINFVFQIANNLSTFASSFFTQPSHTTGELFWWHLDPHIINLLITTTTNGEMLVSVFQEKVAVRSAVNLANMLSYVSQ